MAGGDLTIRAGDTITIAALGLEAWQDDRFDGGYSRRSSLTNRKATATAGGNATITGNRDVGIAGADIEAGGTAAITSETGNVTIAAVQDTRSSSLRLTIETGGFLGTKTEIERDSARSTTQASTIKAGNNVAIASTTQNVTMQASEIESGGETTLSAEQGQVALLANKDTDFRKDKRREEDLVWWSSRDQGHNRETVQHVKIDAEGGLKIVAGQGVIAEIEATGSLNGAISQLSQKPGMAWVSEIRQRNDVEWRKIKPILEEWDHKEQGLTEAGAALVALAVAAVSGGTLTQFSTFIAGALPAGMQSAATTAALKAGMTSLVSRASVSMINNGGDLGAVLKELGSSGSLKALATAMLSAGITAGLPTDVLPKALPGETLSFAEKLQASVVRNVVATSVETAIHGGDIKNNLLNSLKSTGVNQVLSSAHGLIGDATDGTGANDLPVANMVAHALAGGLAAEALGGDFAAGAASGLASSVAANAGLFDGLSPEQIAKVSEVIGGTAALLAGGDARDVNQGATTSQSAALNNYLTHAQIKEFEADLKACGKNANCKLDVTHKFVKLSEQQNADLASCGTLDCIKWHSQRIHEARAASNGILNPYIQADPRYTVQLASLQSTERISASTHVALARVQARSDAVEICASDSTCVERETGNRFETWARQQENKEIIAAAFGVATGAVGIIRGGKVQIVTPERVPNRAIGFSDDTVGTAFAGMREGHAIRHLQGDIIPNTRNLQTRVDAFKEVVTPILTNPTKTAPWRVGATNGRAFLGSSNGKNVVVVVATDGPKQGKVITSFIPDSNQLSIINSR